MNIRLLIQKLAEDMEKEIECLKILLLRYNNEAVEYEQKVEEHKNKLHQWILDLDDFLVQWLWNDKGSIPSQDLAILLESLRSFSND